MDDQGWSKWLVDFPPSIFDIPFPVILDPRWSFSFDPPSLFLAVGAWRAEIRLRLEALVMHQLLASFHFAKHIQPPASGLGQAELFFDAFPARPAQLLPNIRIL